MKTILIFTAMLYTSLSSAQIIWQAGSSSNDDRPTRGTNYTGSSGRSSGSSNCTPAPRPSSSRGSSCNFACKGLLQHATNKNLDEDTKLAAIILRQYGKHAESLLRSLGSSDQDITFLNAISIGELED